MSSREEKLASHITLQDALENIGSSIVKQRGEGLADLKQILRHNQNSSRFGSLDEDTLISVYQSLFQYALDTRSSLVKAKTQTTRSTCVNRLAEIASALRQFVEAGVRALTAKSVNAIVDHVVQTSFYDTGGLCEPLALDYAKTLRIVLGYQPHVEILRKRWETTVEFCVGCIKKAEAETPASDGFNATFATGISNGRSYMSSHSTFREQGSQGSRSIPRPMLDEMMACLESLTAAPTAPLSLRASDILWVVVRDLRSSAVSLHRHQLAFATVNNLISWSRTESVNLTQEATSHLVRLVRQFWANKLSARNEMLITLLFLRPYLWYAIRQPQALTLRADLVGLSQSIQTEYAGRQDSRQLTMEDLRLTIQPHQDDVATEIFKLRCAGVAAESNWVLLYMLASIRNMLMSDKPRNGLDHVGDAEDMDLEMRPKKRPRLDDELTQLMESSSQDSIQARCCAIQVLSFLVMQRPLVPNQLARIISSLIASCGEEAGNIMSWAFLALACCSSQASAQDHSLSSQWASVWQLAFRALTNASSCRPASCLLHLMLKTRLVPQPHLSELVHTMTHSIDLGGPNLLSDASSFLLRSALDAAQNINPGSSGKTAASIVTWLSQKFSPSRLDDKSYIASCQTFEACDVLALLCACLNQSIHPLPETGLRIWESSARAWLQCSRDADTLSYLLLDSTEESVMNPELTVTSTSTTSAASTTRPLPRTETEALVLTYMIAEITRVNEVWKIHSKPSLDMFSMICKALVAAVCLSECISYRDVRQSGNLRNQAKALLDSIRVYVSTPRCEDPSADTFLLIASATLSGLALADDSQTFCPTKCEKRICHALKFSMGRREDAKTVVKVDDAMELDDLFDSQEIKQDKPMSHVVERLNDPDSTFSKLSLRSNTALYAHALVALEEDEAQKTAEAASTVMNYLLSQEDEFVLLSHQVLTMLPRFGLNLSAEDAEALLTHLMQMFDRHALKRSEVALGAVLDVAASLVTLWTDPSHESLYGLGLDIYEFYVKTFLPKGWLSHNAQQRLAILLRQICQINLDYGRDDSSESPTPSARTTFCDLLGKANIPVQFRLANHVSELFNHFTLSYHAAMLEDLLARLPSEVTWTEGSAMRLLVLSHLAVAWPSLLTQCVYHLCESASVHETRLYAARCIDDVASRLPLTSARNLFSLFASQIFYTWLGKDSLAKLPFAAFQYKSLNDFLKSNQSEACAQLAMRESTEGIQLMARTLKLMEGDIIKSAFARSVASVISHDVKDDTKSEQWLRTTMGGGKEAAVSLMAQQFPAIMGRFYLMMRQDDPDETWMEKRSGYVGAWKAFQEMKSYSLSTRPVPDGQQPHFRSKYLPDEIERLCKRTNIDSRDPWTCTSFSLAVRVLVDAIDPKLGSLHYCLMIRRLRILICMAGEVALSGMVLEMLLNTLRPFVSDSECADDTIGIMRYLFQHGRKYLRDQPLFLTGTSILLILQMRVHSNKTQDRTTQQSQHVHTVQQMVDFQRWLVTYLTDAVAEHRVAAYPVLTKALERIQLPGNARRDSAESSLLLFFLEQWQRSRPLCSRKDSLEAIKLLAVNFEVPSTVSDDCLGDDDAAMRVFQPLWETMRSGTIEGAMATWAIQALGRAYAASGVRPVLVSHTTTPLRDKISSRGNREGIAFSQAVIAERLVDLLRSKQRHEAGLADFTLRTILETPGDNAEEAQDFENMLPLELSEAFAGGTFGYRPSTAGQTRVTHVDEAVLQLAVVSPDAETMEQWATRLALVLCEWAVKIPVIASLASIIDNIDGLAAELLPSIIHILLYREVDKVPVLRTKLSSAATDCLSQSESTFAPKQRFILHLVLYLRSRPHPHEATKADRLQWLDVECSLLAEAASRCGMPTTALLFAESSGPSSRTSRRSSARVSTSQLQPVQADETLLLSIYQQLGEPDSFYGVSQPASLESVLSRLDHEQDGFRSLMFRSAQMDSRMQSQHKILETDAAGMVRSLSTLNFNSLAFALFNNGLGSTAGTSSDVFETAKMLQQWDIVPPERHTRDSSLMFSVFQELSRAHDLQHVQAQLQGAVIEHAHNGALMTKAEAVGRNWFTTLATTTEVKELISCSSASEFQTRWRIIRQRDSWKHMARFDDVKAILSNRQTLFSTLAQNSSLQKELHLTAKQCYSFETEALLDFSELSREHSKLQEALTATTSANAMLELCQATNLKVDAAVKVETASVLWHAGEESSSVRMLRDALIMSDLEGQHIAVGRAGLLAQLGHQLAQARLEKPEDILEKYLKPAISHLGDRKDDKEAGKVFYEFAKFCDNEYQNAGNVENFHRMVKLRQGKEEEIETIKLAMKSGKRSKEDKDELSRQLNRAQKWLEIDRIEEKRLRLGRESYIRQSLQNYLSALRATDEHDICVLRFFALWLDNSEAQVANRVVAEYLPHVPSWKLVLLMNQLMSRVEQESSTFQKALQNMLTRIFAEHPYHSVHHLYAASQKPSSSDPAAMSRYNAAHAIFEHINRDDQHKKVMERMFAANRYYKMLAEEPLTAESSKVPLKDVPAGFRVSRRINSNGLLVPPATISLELRPSCNYSDVPHVAKWEETVLVMGGLSTPKALAAIASNGKTYRQLFKSGDDDLRQDAIMEQVFGEVSNMLRNHKATRQRDLKVRTYKVIPLTTRGGIIEFVPNSIPLNDYLRPAHKRYYPQDWSERMARETINGCNRSSIETRVRKFQEICQHLHPVLRHFFFEASDDPDEWFQKRTNYTRTTASISILGHVLGLGDRHCSNILLDRQTGDCVHIDLGVAFEAGRILPVPEMVPFRLTRDVVDGMGATGTEGVFRRCCEFTLDAVREDKDSIMTLLNVLRYDPLYNWTLSPVRAKRMQEAQETGRKDTAIDSGSSKRREQEAGEADRSLSIVEKKLSKTLSTAATVNELIQQATDERNLALLFGGWAAYY